MKLLCQIFGHDFREWAWSKATAKWTVHTCKRCNYSEYRTESAADLDENTAAKLEEVRAAFEMPRANATSKPYRG